MLELIFGLLIFGIVIFIAFKVLHNVVMGILLILLVFVASYLILGSFPSLKSVPIIGKFLPATGNVIATIKNILHNIEILNVARDLDKNLLVTVANTGKNEISNFSASVDNEISEIVNNYDAPLKSGEVTVLQIDWKEDFDNVSIQGNDASATYLNQ